MSNPVWSPKKVINYSEFVSYSEGSIVSKTLFDKPSGSLTLFAIAEGQGIAEHKSPFDATVNVLDGEGVFEIEGEEFVVKAGEALIMPAMVPHAVKAGKAFKFLLIMIR